MGRFTNKIVVITGGTSGIGLAAARQFIKEGGTVVVIGRNPRSVSDAQKEIGANGVAIAADVTKSAELDAQPRRDRDAPFRQARSSRGQRPGTRPGPTSTDPGEAVRQAGRSCDGGGISCLRRRLLHYRR